METRDASEARFYAALKAAGYRSEDLPTDRSLQRMFSVYTGRPWCEDERSCLQRAQQQEPREARLKARVSDSVHARSWMYDGFVLVGSRIMPCSK